MSMNDETYMVYGGGNHTEKTMTRMFYFLWGILVPAALIVAGLLTQYPDGAVIQDEVIGASLPAMFFYFTGAHSRAKDIGISGWWGVLMAVVPGGQLLLMFVPTDYAYR